MTSETWSASSLNCGIVGWLATIPSDRGRRRLSTGYLRCKVRNGGRDRQRALADLVDGVAFRAMDANEGQAALRRRRLLRKRGFVCKQDGGAQRDHTPQ